MKLCGSAGVDAQTCKLIVLDQNIKSMTLFRQIIGRGTRIREDLGKSWFTILDFKRATELFADKDFDGGPVQIYNPRFGDPWTACRWLTSTRRPFDQGSARETSRSEGGGASLTSRKPRWDMGL